MLQHLAILAMLGALVGIPLLVIGLLIQPRIYGAAGTLTGFGSVVLVLFGRIAMTCQPPECRDLFIEPFLAVGAVSLAVGFAILAVGVFRESR